MNIDKIREAGNAMRRELGKICEAQLRDGMMNSAIKSGAACDKWDKALAELDKPAEPDKRRELTDEASHHLFMGWLHANHADINDNADVSDLCRRAFLDALRYARDNGYLAPAVGLTVEEAHEIALQWVSEEDLEHGYTEQAAARLRARLTEAAKQTT